MSRIRVVTLNMHKGLSALHAHSTVYRLKQKMRLQNPDLIFIQEFQQEHRGRVKRFGQWPENELSHFLAEGFWHDWHYGKNVEYRQGHHGNAIFSQHPLHKGSNYDISAYRFERRGLLHSSIQIPGGSQSIHCFCVHLALFERGRERQLNEILSYISSLVEDGPAIVAGDFNDWRNRLSRPMKAVGFEDAFETITGAPAKTFPSVRPLLPMDRIYVRGLKVHSVELLEEWYRLSDHLGIAAELELL